MCALGRAQVSFTISVSPAVKSTFLRRVEGSETNFSFRWAASQRKRSRRKFDRPLTTSPRLAMAPARRDGPSWARWLMTTLKSTRQSQTALKFASRACRRARERRACESGRSPLRAGSSVRFVGAIRTPPGEACRRLMTALGSGERVHRP